MPIPVFYSRSQVVTDNVSNSPSAGKPAEVVASWKERFPIELVGANPASREDFYRAHDPKHVDSVLDGKKNNGFGNRLVSVAMSLPWTTGSFLSAARHALKTGRVAASPTSGFHHAGFAKCEGFCTFNGLMVTALALREKDGLDGKIGILDCDEHFGNGTENIIEELNVPGIHHYTYGDDRSLRKGDGDRWLAQLPAILAQFADCKIVLYQAGADPHTDDPYGRGILSTEQMLLRDLIVFQALKDLGIPVAWNLAGGYQTPLRKVLDIHDNTMRACVEVYEG